jgi:hypothetical protein
MSWGYEVNASETGLAARESVWGLLLIVQFVLVSLFASHLPYHDQTAS